MSGMFALVVSLLLAVGEASEVRSFISVSSVSCDDDRIDSFFNYCCSYFLLLLFSVNFIEFYRTTNNYQRLFLSAWLAISTCYIFYFILFIALGYPCRRLFAVSCTKRQIEICTMRRTRHVGSILIEGTC